MSIRWEIWKALNKGNLCNDTRKEIGFFENFHINVDCSEIVEVSRQYSDDLNSIVDKYEVIWKNERCMRIINQRLDDMRDEVMVATGKVKDYTNCCMSKVSQKLCQQLD